MLGLLEHRADAADVHLVIDGARLERRRRSAAWLEQKRREEGKLRSLRSYPLTAEEAFAAAGEPYFDPMLLKRAQIDAMAPSRAVRGDCYIKSWDIGRKDATVCIVLRSPRADQAQVWDVVDYTRLVDHDYPAIQGEIEARHREYPGPTIIEANSIGLPVIENLNIPREEVIEQKTTQPSKQAMLTELELLLQQWTLKIHPHFQQLLQELADYRVPDNSITQDSVMALGFAVTHRHRAHDTQSGGRINRVLLDDLNATYSPANLAGASLPWVTRN